MRIVLNESKKLALQQEALAIFDTLIKARIRVKPEWIPRKENQIADYISMMIGY